jgi:hypothetical protein
VSEDLRPAPAPTFKVTIETRAYMNGFGGWLTVNHGVLSLVPTKPSRLIGRLDDLRYSGRSVTWVRRALRLPWENRAIEFTPDTYTNPILCALGFAARRHLRETLIDAGFEIVDKASWSILYGP